MLILGGSINFGRFKIIMAIFARLLAILLTILSNGQAQSITILGDNVAYVSADAESGTYVYRLIASPSNSTFTIDSVQPEGYASLFNVDTDALISNAETYPESPTEFNVTVQATNELIEESFFHNITVIVLPSSETNPLFAFTEYNDEIEENQALGTAISYLQAFSLSPTTSKSYSITNGPFFIDEGTGLVTLNGPLDRETIYFYSLNIIYTDDSGTAMTVLKITVLDINDNPPVFELSEYTFSVEESIEIGTEIGNVTATDADLGLHAQVQYTIISGDIDGSFEISSVAGYIINTLFLDYEQLMIYSLIVQACDEGLDPLCSSVTVNINVIDVNDNPPIFTQESYSMFINENMAPGTLVGEVLAFDADGYPNNVIIYELLIEGNATGAFSITMPSEGKIYTNSVLDYEEQSAYELTVVAKDMAKPLLNSTTTVMVTVFNEILECPVFLQSEYVAVVIYDIKDPPVVGHHILTIEAYNPPESSGDLVYTMNITDDSIINDPVFAINATSGNISLARTDISIIGNHILEAKTGFSPNCSTSTIVQISIGKLNRLVPSIIFVILHFILLVIPTCPANVMAGLVWNESPAYEVITHMCSEVSDKFSDR